MSNKLAGLLSHEVNMDKELKIFQNFVNVFSGISSAADAMRREFIELTQIIQNKFIPALNRAEWLCARCGSPIWPCYSETCFWCQDSLCPDCWDYVGHCGHQEADQRNMAALAYDYPHTRWKFLAFMVGVLVMVVQYG